MQCSNCGTKNPQGEQFCTNCGMALLQQQQIISRKVTPPSQVIQKLYCPRCSAACAPGKTFCSKCGQSLKPGASVEPDATHQLVMGMTLNERYKVTKSLGQGGQGAVFKAHDLLLNRDVTIKVLLDASDPEAVQAAIAERNFLVLLNHPGLVKIHDFVEIGNVGYIIEEFVEGETLESILNKRGGPLEPAAALRVMLAILPGLAYFWNAGCVYQDPKPGNVMEAHLKDGSIIYIWIDFGTVREASQVTHADAMGTPGYNARELQQKGGPKPTDDTDRYAAGRMLLQFLSGYTADQMADPINRWTVFDLDVLHKHPSLRLLLERWLHNDPSQRFKTYRDLMQQMIGILRQIAGKDAGIAFDSQLFAHETDTLIGPHGPKAEVLLTGKVDPVLKLGDQALRNGNTAAALNHYNQALSNDPTNEDVKMRLAETLAETSAIAQAHGVVGTMAEGWKKSWTAARVYEMQGDLDQAIQCYREVRKQWPGELSPLQALVRVTTLQGKYEESLDVARVVVHADPTSMLAVLQMTTALWHLEPTELEQIQRTAEAVSAISTHLEDSRYYRALGDLYYAAWIYAGKHPFAPSTVIAEIPDLYLNALADACNRYYREYLKRDPNTRDRDAILRRCLRTDYWTFRFAR